MDGLLDTVSVGAGRAYIVNYEYADVYMEILENLGIDEDEWADYVFIEALTNGGVKGDGLATLKKAITRAKAFGHVLVFVESGADSTRLRNWYLTTGLFRETRLLYVLVAQ